MEKKDILDRIIYMKAVISDISIRSWQYEDDVKKFKDEYASFNAKCNKALSNTYVKNLKSINDYIDELKKFINVKTNNLKQLSNVKSNILDRKVNYGYLGEKKDELYQLMLEKVEGNITKCENSISEHTDYLNKAISMRDIGLENQKKSLESLEELKQKMDKYYKAIQNKLEIDKENIRLLYKSLCEDNKDFISPSDFDKLEYIYYYIETGRSDTVKDALNLVDLQLRHEELVGVLEDAVKTICRVIDYSANEIKKSIGEAKYSICNKINDGFANLNDKMNSINSEMKSIGINMSTMIEQNNEIIDSNRLTNSLIERQNDSCEKMLHDYEYVNRMSGVII